ncbi:hypothetical protein QVN49_10190, partial [Megasphaera hexanoica]|nr:hypothetical protein [Megasphaera hexanoica]
MKLKKAKSTAALVAAFMLTTGLGISVQAAQVNLKEGETLFGKHYVQLKTEDVQSVMNKQDITLGNVTADSITTTGDVAAGTVIANGG